MAIGSAVTSFSVDRIDDNRFVSSSDTPRRWLIQTEESTR